MVIKFLFYYYKFWEMLFHILSHFQTLLRIIKDTWVNLVLPLLTDTSTKDSWTFTGKSGSVSCGDTALFSWVLVRTRFWVQTDFLIESLALVSFSGCNILKSWQASGKCLQSPLKRSKVTSVGEQTLLQISPLYALLY